MSFEWTDDTPDALLNDDLARLLWSNGSDPTAAGTPATATPPPYVPPTAPAAPAAPAQMASPPPFAPTIWPGTGPAAETAPAPSPAPAAAPATPAATPPPFNATMPQAAPPVAPQAVPQAAPPAPTPTPVTDRPSAGAPLFGGPAAAARPAAPTPPAPTGFPRSAPNGPTTGTSIAGGPSNSDDGRRKKLMVAGAAAAVIALLGVGAWVLTSDGDEEEAATASASSTTAAPTTEATTTTSTTTAPTTTVAPTTTAAPVPPAQPTQVAGTAIENTEQRSVYRGGKIYLEGKVQNETLAQEYYSRAVAVLGAANVVNNYVIDPTVQIGYSGAVDVDIPFVFATGSTTISAAYNNDLNIAAAGMSANPSTRMIIVGHTDNVGDPAKNLDLSRRRAEAVRDYIASKGGIDPSRFDVTGAGDTQPVADNNTPEGRAANRRIAVKITNILI